MLFVSLGLVVSALTLPKVLNSTSPDLLFTNVSLGGSGVAALEELWWKPNALLGHVHVEVPQEAVGLLSETTTTFLVCPTLVKLMKIRFC